MTNIPNSIRIAARQTGLSAHVIRVWEKRYGAVKPARTATRRRVYLAADIERLSLLRQATQTGHSIGNVARLSDEQLRKLTGTNGSAAPTVEVTASQEAPRQAVEACLGAVRRLDAVELDALLEQAAVNFGQHGLLQMVVGPLAGALGEQWRAGAITAAHEHMASWIIRLFLGKSCKPFAINGNAPALVVATPAGQIHELGAVMVAAAAADVGWRVTYLGTGLPAAEIAGAARQNHARAVALSIVFPEDDAELPGELQQIHRCLPEDVALLVGGRAAPAYAESLRSIGALVCHDLDGLYGHLGQLRLAASRQRTNGQV